MVGVHDGLGIRLTLARRARELTQVQAAIAIGVGANAVGRWESEDRQPKVEDLKKLATLYGTTVAWLVGEAPLIPDADSAGETPEVVATSKAVN